MSSMSVERKVRANSSTMSKEDISVDEILSGIQSSLEASREATSSLSNDYKDDKIPSLVSDLLEKSSISKLEGVSLLSLKNHSLLSYITYVVLIVLSHLERLKETNDDAEIEKLKQNLVQDSAIQRVCIEKGIKPLERRLGYQLDKMVRAYVRMESDSSSKLEKMTQRENGSQHANDENSEDSEESEDELSYKPDASAFAKTTRGDKRVSSEDKPTKEKYRPPKISAMAPPATFKEQKRSDSTRKLQSMEEYLRDNSDMPEAQASVGSTIVGHGRFGVKSDHDRKKEREIQNYEESNFTRLPSTATKKDAKKKRHDMKNTFAGEDWSLFNNKRKLDETSRKRKPTSVWDKVKRKRA
ncbi:Piso0_003561 [Millerozyma farinosa CBS 7064]|uniref:Piso0_003561 protein n=1 Tax=Pichia sorbitophila (strain ATCC MYA-4447 / BCRC 22081 / CBS 7064 / NBRC 10061 / NRRL Y-12695) TaxID=559304 RepID=G8YJF0_PICSO|nr:Piso0_003561 [Millerozyma farinosa CBS 7064]CCE81210.1 Piso0_003561 [Millerozyma farinosa CBS 7064]